ncbi:DUF3710 domain-containing protein [Rhodococcus sp. X156]|uniref:DUF3710 domain-containing protein n=1 Tax=Rhodococcus sp. X156 TaxID=2499145 RepID=UPI000FD80692|nr:DUF3710 domain-containing protein [Rhodococcus sp. X156]
MFGRRNKRASEAEAEATVTDIPEDLLAEQADDDADIPADGPYDSSEVDAEPEADGRLDLGSVRVPLLEGAQIQVEMEEDGTLRALHLLTEVGRITIAAFAAPRSEGMWREVLGELAQSLKDDGAEVRLEDGHWGREVIGVGAGATMRFIGVDGPRWMVRCVAAGPDEKQAELADVARALLRDTVVVRGTEPLPVRSPLPVRLPTVLADQLEAARAQQDAGAQGPAGEESDAPDSSGQPSSPQNS